MDPETWPGKDGGLLIDEALLALDREGLVLLQIIRGPDTSTHPTTITASPGK